VRRISKQTWEQIKAGYAAGIGLREIARKMNVPEGTVLARAKREGWTQQIAAAKQAIASAQSNAITSSPLQSIAAVMQERGQRHRERIAGVTEKVLPHLESMQPDSILDRVSNIEKYDRLARRNSGLSDNKGGSGMLNLNVLAGRGRAIIAIDQPPNRMPAQDQP